MSRSLINSGFVGNEDGVRFRYPHQLAEVLATAGGEHPLDILDLGSAAGSITAWLVDRNNRFRVTGIDSDTAVVAAAQAALTGRGAAARFVVADAGGLLPLGDESVDGVVVHRLRDNLVDPSRRAALAGELRRVLRPNGWISLLEDMRIEPAERHGAWYARRYAVNRRVLEILVAGRKFGLGAYVSWLADPETALLMSLREPDGTKVDDVAFTGREAELAQLIASGHVRLRGVGIHRRASRVRAEFSAHGLTARRRWRVEIPELPPRAGHAAVMKGVLLQRGGRQGV